MISTAAVDLSEMSYRDFQKILHASTKEISREVYLENRDSIHIKKEKTAVKNYGKIIDAVFKISYAKGFQAMSVRDLSNETGMSIGALYRYFAGKDELLAIIQRQGQTMIKRVLEKFTGASDEPLEKLRAVVKAHIFLSEAYREWFFFAFMEARNLNRQAMKEALLMEAYTEKLLVDILKQGQRRGVFLKRDNRMTASMIKAMQQDWYLKRWKYARRKVSVDRYAEYVLEIVESFCVAQGSGRK